MKSRGIAAVVLLGALALAGCDQSTDPAAVTVTETVTVVRDAPAPKREPVLDDQACEGIKAMRDTNKRLAKDGYADDYSKEYDQQLRAAGCIP